MRYFDGRTMTFSLFLSAFFFEKKSFLSDPNAAEVLDDGSGLSNKESIWVKSKS